jgi:hypothetical protein
MYIITTYRNLQKQKCLSEWTEFDRMQPRTAGKEPEMRLERLRNPMHESPDLGTDLR